MRHCLVKSLLDFESTPPEWHLTVSPMLDAPLQFLAKPQWAPIPLSRGSAWRGVEVETFSERFHHSWGRKNARRWTVRLLNVFFALSQKDIWTVAFGDRVYPAQGAPQHHSWLVCARSGHQLNPILLSCFVPTAKRLGLRLLWDLFRTFSHFIDCCLLFIK